MTENEGARDADLRGFEQRGTGRGREHEPSHPALVDELTGLPNRTHFNSVFDVVFEMGDRGYPLTVLLFEFDGWEDYVVQRGEEPSVKTLKEFGLTLARHIRKTDLIARLDQGRFVLLLMDSNLQGGLLAADRFEDLLADFCRERGLTFSVGLASYRPGMETPDDLLSLGVRTLEAAQAAGGGCVRVPADVEKQET